MTTILLPHNHFDVHHLERVKAEMATLGAPKIKAVWMECYGAYAALEGTHRLRAAAALGIAPEIDEVEWSDSVTTDEVVPGQYQDTWTIAEVCQAAYQHQAIEFSVLGSSLTPVKPAPRIRRRIR